MPLLWRGAWKSTGRRPRLEAHSTPESPMAVTHGVTLVDRNRMRQLRRALAQLHATHWMAPIRQWLEHFRGLESRSLGEARPVDELCAILGPLSQSHHRLTNEELAQTLVRAPFLCWRACCASGTRWKPLEQSLEQFAAALAPFELRLWCSDCSEPAPDQWVAWLIARVGGRELNDE